MIGRPEWIGADKFRIWMTANSLARVMTVDGMLPASFIARENRQGRPINARLVQGSKRYRPIDLWIRARSRKLRVENTPYSRQLYKNEMLAKEIEELEGQKNSLEKSIAAAEESMSIIAAAHSIVSSIGIIEPTRSADERVRLLSSDEIVGGSIPFSDYCGVYFLIEKSSIVYVGQSVNIFSRLSNHAKNGKRFDAVSFVECPKDSLDAIEAIYIGVLRPPLNRVRPALPLELMREAIE